MAKPKVLTEKQQAYRKNLLMKVHTAEKYTQFYAHYQDDYRAMLSQHFGVESAAKLSIDELKVLVDFLNGRNKAPVVLATPAQLSYLRHQWQRKAKNPSEAGIRKLCEKLFGVSPLRLEMLSKKQVSGLINAVNRM